MNRIVVITLFALGVCLTSCTSSGSSSAAPGETEDQRIARMVKDTLEIFTLRDPGAGKMLDEAYGYAVLPNIGKLGLIVAGAGGRGQVFEQKVLIGTTEMSQGTIGVTAGAQIYREILLFRDKPALDRFKDSKFEFSGNASAIAVKAGAATAADYANGIAVFSIAEGGLMFEASIGGQGFSFHPLVPVLKP